MEKALFASRLRLRIKGAGCNGEIRTTGDGSMEWIPRADQTPSQITTAQGLLSTDEPSLLAWENQNARSLADASMSADTPNDKRWKGFVLVSLDELNLHAQKFADLLSAIAAATSLADLKTRAGLIAAVPQRTAAQIKTAVANKVDSGLADG